MSDTYTDGIERIETEVVDPEAPVRFVRLVVDGDEQAMIPWDEAKAISKVVERYDDTDTDR